MNKYVAAYAGAAVVLVALDLLWLGVIARPLYQQGIGHLMAESPNLSVAVVFYLLYAMGVVIFAVSPQHDGASWGSTLATAGMFGFFAYATYDLTNLATLREWPLALSFIDIGWGAVVTVASAAGGKAALDLAAGAAR